MNHKDTLKKFNEKTNEIIAGQLQIHDNIVTQAMPLTTAVSLHGQSTIQETLAIRHIRDLIHELQEHQKELEQQNERLNLFRSLIDHASDIILMIDFETGLVIDSNERACKLLGYDNEKLLSMNIREICNGIPETVSWKEHSEKLREMLNMTIECNAKGKDCVFDVEINGSYVKQGDKEYIIATMRDISEGKAALNALAISEAKYKRLVEGLDSEYLFYSHGTDGVFTYLSPSVTTILGYSPEEFGTHYTEYLTDHPMNKMVIEATEQGFQGIKSKSYKLEIYHKDGSTRILDVTETPVFDETDTVIGIEGIAKNISDLD